MKDKIARLSQSIDELIAFYNRLPDKKLKLSSSSEWGALETLIHLVFWHEQYVSILKSKLEGKEAKLLIGTFKEWNKKAVELNREVSVDELLIRLKIAQQKLENFSQDKKADSFKISFKEGSHLWLFPVALIKIDSHIRNHLSNIHS